MPRPWMLKKWEEVYGWKPGEVVCHHVSGKRFKLVEFAPGGNMARSYLKLRPVLKNGRLGKAQVKDAAYFDQCKIEKSPKRKR